MIYLNNAATSHPKPAAVVHAVVHALEHPADHPGRGSGHAADPLLEVRRRLADLVGLDDPLRVVLTASATHALNLALFALFGRGREGRCVATTMDHNSLRRPLHRLATDGLVVLSRIGREQLLHDPASALAQLPRTATVLAITHASNVTGDIVPLQALAGACIERGITLLLDASQSVGCVPIDMRRLPERCLVAFSGHKALHGPQGVGALCVSSGMGSLDPLLLGGTGVRSADATAPEEMPLRLEPGTANGPGAAGLAAAVALVAKTGIESVGRVRHELAERLYDGIRRVTGVRTFPPFDGDFSAGIVAFVVDGWGSEEAAFVLGESFDVRCRAGLHCAPLLHDELGTAVQGTVRFSLSAYTTVRELDVAVAAVAQLARGARR